MPEWEFLAFPQGMQGEASASMIRTCDAGSYSFRSRWGTRTLNGLGVAGATCGAVADITQAYLDARPGILGLHCGAIRLGGQLVVFTGPYRAGKTTLVTRLAMEPGVELFCDDVLPVEPGGKALALGIQPRVRLPLPCDMSMRFRALVERGLTLFDDRYGYVALPGQAPFGTRASVAAVVVLRRQDGAAARFSRLRAEDAAACFIRQNIGDPGDMNAHYDEITDMAESVPCLELVFSDLEEAAAHVCEAFEGGKSPAARSKKSTERPIVPEAVEFVPAALEQSFSRSTGVIERLIGADTFLWQLDSREFFRLNVVGGAVWALLDDPVTGQEIAETLSDAFPEMDHDVIATDVALLLGQMSARGLIESSCA